MCIIHHVCSQTKTLPYTKKTDFQHHILKSIVPRTKEFACEKLCTLFLFICKCKKIYVAKCQVKNNFFVNLLYNFLINILLSYLFAIMESLSRFAPFKDVQTDDTFITKAMNDQVDRLI